MRKLFILFTFLLTFNIFSQNKIPKELEPWIGWATWDAQETLCPTAYNSGKKHFCVWPSRLNIDIFKKKGSFSQKVTVFAESYVLLPGNTNTWPFNVKVNKKEIPVIEHNNSPAVKLSKGTYLIQGDFFWNSIPSSIKIPVSTGIVKLKVENKEILFPKRTNKGFLQLTNLKTTKKDKDYLSHKVFFLLEDGIPLKLQIIVKLTVSGVSREKNLNTVIPLNFKVESITSDIPATIEKNNLKVQVRSGKWTIKIKTFCLNNISKIQFPNNKPLIAKSSFLAFKADRTFRVLDVKAGALIDPSETDVPKQWQMYPVFFWDLKTPAKLIEQQRGSLINESDTSLTLKRNLWLNENGKSYIFKDTLQGKLNSITRIDANSNIIPGRFSLNGKDLLITENPFTKNKGVELRNSNINLEVVGKIKGTGKIPISGWDKNINKTSMTINLPPGYRAFAIFGADKSYGDWLSSWNLLDIFLLLIFSVAMSRLWGLKAGIITFIGFAIMYHEPGAPKFIWFALLIPVALLQVIKEGNVHQLLTYLKYLTLFFFVLIITPFIAKQGQLIIYPQLEKNTNISVPYETTLPTRTVKSRKKEKIARATILPTQYYEKSDNNLNYTPSAKVQTGPGIPLWSWKKVTCSWNRTVSANETLTPVLIPPVLTKLLYVLRIVFLLLITMIMLNIKLPVKSKGIFIVLIFLLSGTTLLKASVPDKDTLNLLKSRILKQADCYPHCGEIEWLKITVSNKILSYSAKIHTATLTAIPLPGLINSLTPLSATVDNYPAPLRKGDKYLFVALKKGVHIVNVKSAIPNKDSFNLSFDLVPKKVTIDAPLWNFSGVSDGFKVDKQIFFTKKQTASTKKNKNYSFESENPLVILIRKVELMQNWQVITTVKRLSNTKQPLAIGIPLLANEKPLSANVKVSKQKFITVKLASGQKEFSLKSELPFSNQLVFHSNKGNLFTEQWVILCSPMWNVTYKGLPPIYSFENNAIIPIWKPWPGESLTLNVTKPKPVKGQTVTVKKVNYKGVPGNNLSTYTLSLSVESSTGSGFSVKLPKNAKVTSVKRNKKTIVAKVKNEIITIPLLPSKQEITIDFSTTKGIGIKTQMAKIELLEPATNIYLTLKVPQSRWILLTNGPLIGPAVRFWGLFILMLITAFILGSLKNSPLTKTEWLLLTVGLSQIPVFLSLIVIIWLFWLKWRGEYDINKMPNLAFNLQQLALIGITFVTLIIFLAIVYEGLMGRPEMYIVGNNSSIYNLHWYKGEVNKVLPQPYFISLSIWVYRIIMLLWALWLSNSLIKWLKWGFKQFGKDKYWI